MEISWRSGRGEERGGREAKAVGEKAAERYGWLLGVFISRLKP
jgi:hypothetical protein